jgi:hypothetical protein
MNTDTVSSLWIGNVLSPLERLSIRSWIAMGHTVKLYCYSEIDNIPNGVDLQDANSIIALSMMCPASDNKRLSKSYTFSANRFRYELLARYGGVWLDLDMVLLEPLRCADDYLFAKVNSSKLNNAVLGVGKPGMSLAVRLAEVAADPLKLQPWDTLDRRLKKRLIQYGVHPGHKEVPSFWSGPMALNGVV